MIEKKTTAKADKENKEDTSTSLSTGKDEVKFSGRFIPAIGRRKTATAQVRLYKKGAGVIIVNGMKASKYFAKDLVVIMKEPLKMVGVDKEYDFSILVKGGGKSGQAEAVRHGFARVLLKTNEELKQSLNAKGWLTRDARKKERKKPGLKKARKAPQWSKR